MTRAARDYTTDASTLLGDAQELLQHIPRGLERRMLSTTLKPEVADAIVDAIVELRERVHLFASREGLRWHPLLGWLPKDSACFDGQVETALENAPPVATHSSGA
jgi:hypothetical protein